MKNKLLVSFSGGETSAYMAQWLWNNKRDEYDMIFVFANTGEENEETLLFIDKFSKHFNIEIIWVEAVVNKGRGNGTTHKVVDFKSASRKGEPFEQVIAKYGIPNQASPHCSRELKGAVITSYARTIGWEKYYTAIGIRVDEIDRMNSKRKQKRILYPLISMIETVKPDVNNYWKDMPFRLNLKGYEGNCKWCWKKSTNKLIKIAKDNPEHFDFPKSMEIKYGNFFPAHRKDKYIKEGKVVPTDIKFFRNNVSAEQILEMAKIKKPIVKDDSVIYYRQRSLFDFIKDDDNESCEPFSQCGVDN